MWKTDVTATFGLQGDSETIQRSTYGSSEGENEILKLNS